MTDLNELRIQFSRRERDVLSTIWIYYLKDEHWLSTRGIHEAQGGKKIVRPILEKFGGSVIYEFEEHGINCYSLTFLGVLLATGGEIIEEMLVRYIQLIKNLSQKEIKRTHVSSHEVSIKMDLDPGELNELGNVLFLSPLISGGSKSRNEWNAGLPKDIEDIPDDPHPYILDLVLSSYDPDIPLPSQDRMIYLNSTSAGVHPHIFIFVGNEALRSIATQDWKEARLCFQAKAWKSTIIACGSVLEAILLDALLGDPDRAIAKYRSHFNKEPQKDLRRWTLESLVNVASMFGIISDASQHLGHALRLHRDLVHPGRLLRELVDVTEGEAQISINTVEKCIRDLTTNLPTSGEEAISTEKVSDI